VSQSSLYFLFISSHRTPFEGYITSVDVVVGRGYNDGTPKNRTPAESLTERLGVRMESKRGM
jgi:hypothetical protein